jgi:cellulose synthase/poly-beta-1,6-N-acetylglucosamine synthase-like glycosyltransferase/exo-beta-1,3-glucanase (GH17 family)
VKTSVTVLRQKGPITPALLAALIVLLIHGGLWFLLRETVSPPAALQGVGSLSYTVGAPGEQNIIMDDDVRARVNRDMQLIAKIARGIRLYAARGRNAEVIPIARAHGLNVVAGAWIGADSDENNLEIRALYQIVSRYSYIRDVIVGNETLLRKDLEPAALIDLLHRARRKIRQPVSTAETWDIWLAHPELVPAVDFIALHVLPYWEGIDPDVAVDYALDRYKAVRKAYPGKRIVIAEFGWPSKGYNNRDAGTGATRQAEVIRSFLRAVNDQGIEFNIIEAFDQPWKSREGSVGAYWGLLDADGNAKFPLIGEFRDATFYPRLFLALALGLLASVVVLAIVRSTMGHALVISLTCNALSTPLALALLYPLENYLNVGSAIAWAVGILLMVPLTLMTLVKVHEVADVTLGFTPRRLITGPIATTDTHRFPKVSIQIPAHRENPDVLIATLNSVAKLNYPDFEVLVVINNTPEEALWQPVEATCRALGSRFKFLNLMGVQGFKAGALNQALSQVSPDAEVIALLDADYEVHADWLKDLVPYFVNQNIALIQAPQDHRDAGQSFMKTIMNSEYAGFFDIGMVQRNENDAIVAHGTMLLLRRSAFDAVGGWATDTITEDTELGLRLFEAGFSALYTDHRYGYGLLPDTMQAFITQRHRWAFGAMQIIRKHWRHMLPWSQTLKTPQKAQFVTGWCYWLADAFGVLAAGLNVLWVPMILFVGVLIPTLPFTLPILAMFFVNLLHCLILYLVRVRIAPKHIFGAALAAMSLQFTVGCAVAEGLLGVQLAFKRTDKGGGAQRTPFPARREFWFGAILIVGAAALYISNTTEAIELNVFAITLLVQSLPFLAAVVLAYTERLTAKHEAPLAQPAQ